MTDRVVALVTDLADRVAIGDGARYVRRPEDLDGIDADVVIVDLSVPGALDAITSTATGSRVVAYGAHVATELLAEAAERGAEVMPRSRFFRERPWQGRD
jgi:hypothetical protein